MPRRFSERFSFNLLYLDVDRVAALSQPDTDRTQTVKKTSVRYLCDSKFLKVRYLLVCNMLLIFV